METRLAEVGDGIFQLTTVVPGMPLAFNQYVIVGDEPTLFHTGMRGIFPEVLQAVTRVLPIDSLRWVAFGHVEADECGAMNQWLARAPHATVVQSEIGCDVSVADLADRPPHPMADGDLLDIGGHVLQWFNTPHVPHAWEAGVLYDVTTRTLFCGDLFTRYGSYEPLITDDIVGPAVDAEDSAPGSLSLHPASAVVVRRLADLEITTLAPMHSSAFVGDCRQALLDLADDFERRIHAVSQ